MKPEHSPLGKISAYAQQYQPDLLFPIARALNRATLPGGEFNGFGADLWTAYEVSWLTPSGKPQVAIAGLVVAADSRCLIESKSLKLYLNSFNQTRLERAQLVQYLEQDLSRAAESPVEVRLWSLDEAQQVLAIQPLSSQCLDELEVVLDQYQLQPDLLRPGVGRGQQSLHSHLLKSNCLVTGQPDWGSVFIDYRGEAIDNASLLAYLVSFRQHQEFHEHCVERIFTDLSQRFDLEYLRVEARYVRRGGLDINPIRCSEPTRVEPRRLVRQ